MGEHEREREGKKKGGKGEGEREEQRTEGKGRRKKGRREEERWEGERKEGGKKGRRKEGGEEGRKISLDVETHRGEKAIGHRGRNCSDTAVCQRIECQQSGLEEAGITPLWSPQRAWPLQTL